MPKFALFWKMTSTTGLLTFIAVFFSAFVSFCSAADDPGDIILKGMNVGLENDNLIFRLEVDNLDGSYVKATPFIVVSRGNQIIMDRELEQYILLPNRTNMIAVYYSKSFFEPADYTVESGIRYDTKESNTIRNMVSISPSWQIRTEGAKEIISPVSSSKEQAIFGNTYTLDSIALIVALVILIVILAERLRLKSFNTEVNNTSRMENMQKDNIQNKINLQPVPDVADHAAQKPVMQKEANQNEIASPAVNSGFLQSLGNDVIQAINEEKERFNAEIKDLERLHDKGILDSDIFERNKKVVEDKLEQISMESVLNSGRSTKELKENLSEKIRQREEKIINSINMLDKLHSDDILDEDTFQKNKRELSMALDKLKALHRIDNVK